MTPDLSDLVAAIIRRTEWLRQRAEQSGDAGRYSDLEKIQAAARHFSDRIEQAVLASEGPDPRAFTPTDRHGLLNSVNQMTGYAEMLIQDAQQEGALWPVEDLEEIVAGSRHLTAALTSDGTHLGEPPLPPTEAIAAPRFAPAAAHPLLVVDDDAANRELLSNRLERQGFKVLAASDGLRALEILEREPIDLVLLDVLMPELNGYQVLERMKRSPALRGIPVLMISGLHEIDSVVRCIEMGADDYLPKPPNPVLLQARIGACLERKQLRDQEQRTFQALKASQEALAAELAEAADYVRSLLPPPIQTDDVALDWRFIPSSQLGGDAFGYQWLDTDHLAVYLFDVCGHGVGAALLSVSIINVLRSGRLRDADMRQPGEVLQALNNTFQMDQHNGQYFTIWYGVYDRRSRQLEHASGGHPPAVMLSRVDDSPAVTLLPYAGMIVGAFPDQQYGTSLVQVPPGSRLYVFSDGLYERETTDGSMFDYESFVRMLAAPDAAGLPVLDRVIAQLRKLGDTEAFEDDASIVEISFA